MTIFLISGNGQGAGKTTMAHKLVGERATFSLANTLRQELKRLYPDYDWFNRTQEYKDNTQVYTYGRVKGEPKVYSVRQAMIEYGQEKCKDDPAHWAKKLVARLAVQPALSVIAIDDVRKMVELEVLKRAFPNVYHFHIVYSEAVTEPMYDADELEQVADYIVIRNPK